MPLFRKSKDDQPPAPGTPPSAAGPDVDGLIRRGLDHLQAGRFPAAIAVLEEALAASPGPAAPHAYLAQAYARIGNGPAALRHYEAFRAVDPANAARIAENDPWLTAGGTVRSLRTEQRGQNTYESYACADPAAALEFLEKREVDRPLYYVDVETPDGIWGTDIDGVYQARLPDWKKDLDLAECDGVAVGPPVGGFQYCAKGLSDNFVVTVACGRCGHEWLGALRYQAVTIARCPACGAYNKVDSSNYRAVMIDGG